MQGQSNFNFSSTKSFQLFAEGLESLQAYEKTAANASLNAAEQSFQQCVDQFPADILPRFYYGVVKTLRGYEGLDEAIKQFTLVREKAEELKPDAIYNLAVAHIEKYSSKDSEIAKKLLKDTTEEIAKRPRDPKNESLRLQARILEIYLFVQGELWEHREDVNRPSEEVFKEAKKDLKSFWSDYRQSAILELTRPDLIADYKNTWGTYWESRAFFAKERKKKALSLKAKKSYEESLEAKGNWIPAKSNLARLYQDLLGDRETAKTLWCEVLESRPRDEYANYNLGRLYESEGHKLRAMAFYKKSRNIPEAVLALGRMYAETDQMERAQECIRKLLDQKDLRAKTKDSARRLLERLRPAPGSTHA